MKMNSTNDEAKAAEAKRFPELVVNFRKAIYDQLKETHGEQYIPSTAALRIAAFKAAEEVFGSEIEPVPNRLALNVWNAVMLCNESAFHQGMERDIKAGVLQGIKIVKGARAVAQGYF